MSILDIWKKRTAQRDKHASHEHAKVIVTEAEVEKSVKEAPASGSKRVAGQGYAVLIRPIVSEKTAGLETDGVYTFQVAESASKDAIKQAVKEVYGVWPTRVRVISGQGKWVRFGRFTGRRSDWKKALVTLPKGQSIRIHEGV